MNHETAETLSPYLDGEVEADARARIDGHLAACGRCAALLLSLDRAGAAVRALPEVRPTPEESRAIRLRLAEDRPQKRLPLTAPAWALVGTLGVIVAGTVAFTLLRPPGELAETVSAPDRPEAAVAGEELAFEDDREVLQAVLDNPEVTSRVGAYTVAEVAEEQPRALDEFSEGGASFAAALRSSQDRAGEEPTGADEGTARSLGYCLRTVLRTQPYPLMPVLAAPALWKGEPAWLLVYAYTNSREAEARLDRLQIWVVHRVECRVLNHQTPRT